MGKVRERSSLEGLWFSILGYRIPCQEKSSFKWERMVSLGQATFEVFMGEPAGGAAHSLL